MVIDDCADVKRGRHYRIAGALSFELAAGLPANRNACTGKVDPRKAGKTSIGAAAPRAAAGKIACDPALGDRYMRRA